MMVVWCLVPSDQAMCLRFVLGAVNGLGAVLRVGAS